jgi:hypothetical protein
MTADIQNIDLVPFFADELEADRKFSAAQRI